MGGIRDLTPQTYTVTVRIWTKSQSSGTDWVETDALPVNLIVTDPGLYVVSLKPQSLSFTDSVRVGISLRDDGAAPIPAIPLRLGVDSDGTDSAPPNPFGHSYRYNSTAVPPANPWLPALTANYGIHAAVHPIPAFGCRGFLPPLDGTITMESGGRSIPLKAMLFDDAGFPVTQSLLASPPHVQFLYASDTNVVNPIDVTDAVVPAGRSAAGQSFSETADNMWSYNFKTSKDLPAGIYTVHMKSGDGMEYLIDPTCVGKIVIRSQKPSNPSEAPKDSKLPPSKGLK
jgi:hypothetical protein